MKIALVITSLTDGGAQRVAATLANSWSRAGHAVRIMTFECPGTRPDFALDSAISLLQLDLVKRSNNALRAAANNLHRIRILRRHLRHYAPDVAMAMMTEPNILAVLASLGRPWPTVISERVHPTHQLTKPWPFLRRRLYPHADAIVVQTVDIA